MISVLSGCIALLTIPSLFGQEQFDDRFVNQTIWQALRSMARSDKRFEFAGIATVLQAECNRDMRDRLADPNQTSTLFAPTNQAFFSFFPEKVPLRGMRCNLPCSRNQLQLFPGSQYSVRAFEGCMSELVRYHIVPDLNFIALKDLGNVSLAVTVLPTYLTAKDAPEFVRLADGMSQMIVVNQTASGLSVNQWVKTGGYQPANIVRKNIRCLNGMIQGIDRVLIPPANAFTSLSWIDPRPATNALRTPSLAEPVHALKNITMFWPASRGTIDEPLQAVERSIGQLYNYTDYIVEGMVVFNNQTSGSVRNETISGAPIDIQYEQDYNMTVNGIRVIGSNVLIENGVLHVLERPFNSTNSED